MPGPTVTIKCSQCGQSGTIRQRDVKRLKRPWLCAACRSLPEHNPNWKGGPKPAYYYKLRSIKRHPERHAARVDFAAALKAGRIQRKPCEMCGKRKAHGHHDDYSQPLKVRWLCEKHHRLEHTR